MLNDSSARVLLSYQRGWIRVLEDVVDEDGEVRVVAEELRQVVERVRLARGRVGRRRRRRD